MELETLPRFPLRKGKLWQLSLVIQVTLPFCELPNQIILFSFAFTTVRLRCRSSARSNTHYFACRD